MTLERSLFMEKATLETHQEITLEICHNLHQSTQQMVTKPENTSWLA